MAGSIGRMLRERAAQATVEAALLLPTFLTVLLLALQPLCLLYTRAVMEAAAGETARLMITAGGEATDACEAFALRRLAAVPDLSIFHAGGPYAWEIELVEAAEGSGTVTVGITGAVTPLPVLGAFAGALGTTNAHGDIEMHVEVSYAARPEWLEGDYASWAARWD